MGVVPRAQGGLAGCSPVLPQPSSPNSSSSERRSELASSPLSGQPQIGQGKGGLNSRGQKEISTLSLHGTQMSPKVTMAFAHYERDMVGADRGTTTGVPDAGMARGAGCVGGRDRRGSQGPERQEESEQRRNRGWKGWADMVRGPHRGARRNPHQAGCGRGIAKDQKSG